MAAEYSGFVGSFRVFAQHGLLIFRDVRSADTHDGFDGKVPVHARPDSIYLKVRTYVDGPVSVEVFEDESDDLTLDGAVLFDGTISSEYGEFTLHDPDEWIAMKVITDNAGAARLRVSADAERSPSALRLQIWY
ncbi:hypothetical protein FB565_006158 [Actinoplanes lutulentus]|uniref:Uncharacterized protein n=1 Tax=Actinoplanes lutulentus TaxID=1287878 RepID=A0A327Z248_9ACTN|nr:hypothetical protein [Actinoplanes lutulentus]MBB2946390.1 hypothetical protein [Actinoplanes lutulentus]RAK28672.1 hypothetical protein B0I29_1199 [Actinoplanes lutulentus]